MHENIILDLAKELKVSAQKITTVLTLLEDNTVPFIARYRKEMTGGLDETELRTIHTAYESAKKLKERKDDVIRLIDEKGLLTEELQKAILAAEKLVDVEDLYRPYKEKKKTKATMAVAQGLEPLAQFLWEADPSDPQIEAQKYLTDEVTSVEEALEGARYIIAETISDEAQYRQYLRTHTLHHGEILSTLKKDAVDEREVYRDYYDFATPLKKLKLITVLALNRGEKEKVLNVKIQTDEEAVFGYLDRQVIADRQGPAVEHLALAVRDAYKRLIKPSIEREIRSDFTAKAEEHAIHIFGENLYSLLLQPPMKQKVVLGVDPAFRTGCKLAVVDALGQLQDIAVIYPHEARLGDAVNPKKRQEAQDKVISLLKKHRVDIIAIGNGTASRETEQFIVETIQAYGEQVFYIIVNEAGASVYSASPLAKKEFPELSVEERSAISIARRLQDPLSELVKIDPQSIGVGQYQHDVSQNLLSASLTAVVETAVNQVGVNVNTASAPLLEYVSGLSKKVAENIVKVRETEGAFTNRKTLMGVPSLGAKTYEQAIGFLRILDGENPLDKTAIHPESYKLTYQILKALEVQLDDVGTETMRLQVSRADASALATQLGAGLPTVEDILEALAQPLRDPRDAIAAPLLKSDLLKLEDLKPGMALQGTVRNVVDFGVFVDCGVKQDGLVHISQLRKGFVKHPMDVVKVGDIVHIWVKDVDLKRERLQLTMMDPQKN